MVIMMRKYKIQLAAAMIIFGTIGLVRRYIPYTSGLVAFARGFLGALFLLILHIVKNEKFPRKKLRENAVLLTASGAALGINWIFLFEAYQYTTVSAATMSYYMAPVFVILASPFMLDEKISLKKGAASLTAVIGMVLVSGVADTGIQGGKGIIFGLAAAVFYAGLIILNKKIENLSSKDRTIFQLGIAAAVILPYVIITEDFSSIEIEAFPLFMLLIAGILHTGIAYALYFGSMRKVPAQTVALFSYIDPVTAVILSSLVLKEEMTAAAAAGVVMIIGSALISEIDFSNIIGKKKRA